MKNNRRIVITGIGIVSPVGTGKDLFWHNISNGVSGIKAIEYFDTEGYSSKIAGVVEGFDAEDYIDKKEIRRMDKFQHFAIAAAKMACADSELVIDNHTAHRIGVIVGSGIGGIGSMANGHRTLLKRGPKKISPFLIPMMITDLAAGHISIALGAKGPNYCTTSACASASHSIGESFEMIRKDATDVMITGGAEAPLTPLGVASFCAARALSSRNDEPEKASRPFDIDRDGFVMGEGAGIIIVEELKHALNRGAHIYTEIIGYGATADAYHVIQPDPTGNGAISSMAAAIEQSGHELSDIDYINAHGTSTEIGDIAETKAIKKLFSNHADKLLVSSTKSVTGHLLGAAGAIEAIACSMAINERLAPPTINLDNQDPKCDLNYVPNKAIKKDIKLALSNSFGFGGHNASLLIKEFEE